MIPEYPSRRGWVMRPELRAHSWKNFDIKRYPPEGGWAANKPKYGSSKSCYAKWISQLNQRLKSTDMLEIFTVFERVNLIELADALSDDEAPIPSFLKKAFDV